ncbi:hypothetical protein [uncultured Litoreibacter sp.]|uniref:hypothetical protein n=1 Tax=uncultured Litoreibacter sp. TaxID=1392394 RepID=UPI002621EB82|nr:hypothetical protein [uncultured Litoreibacter sp.]
MLSALRPKALAVFMVLLGACTDPLSQETGEEFQSLANAAASFVGAPGELQRKALRGAREHQNVCNYLNGRPYALGEDRTKINVSKLAAEQEAAGKALKSYVEALVDASRGGSISKLDEAKEKFQSGAGDLLKVANVSSLKAGVISAGVALAVRAGESRRQQKIRDVMWSNVDTLARLEILLSDDLSRVTRETEAAVAAWDRATRCVLRANRSRSDAIPRLQDYDQQRLEMSKLLGAVRNAPAAVKKLRFAHLIAAKSPESFEDTIKDVVEVLQELDAIRDAVN